MMNLYNHIFAKPIGTAKIVLIGLKTKMKVRCRKMAKRELIDRTRLLTENMKSKYYHLANGDIAIPIIDIEHSHTITDQEIVKPYLENLKKQIRYDYNRNIWGQYEYEKVMHLIDNLLSEQEG